MKNLKNKKGFTLVELLAVIVVLAIIMIIAIPNVLSSMDTAKKSSFIIEARKVLNKAQEQYQADTLTGSPKACYTITDLGTDTGGKYKGYVTVSNNVFTIYLSDGEYRAEGATSSTLDETGDTAKVKKSTTEYASTCPSA